MKIVWSDGDVMCLVQADVHLPLKTFLEDDILSMESCRLDSAAFGAPGGLPFTGLDVQPLFVADLPPEHFGRPGLIVASNPVQACQFMAAHWVPQGFGALDVAVRATQVAGDNGHHRFDAMVPFIERESDDWLMDPREGEPQAMVILRSKFEKAFRRFGKGVEQVYLPARSRRHRRKACGFVAVIREHGRRIRGRSVPGWDMLLSAGAAESGRVSSCFDGRWREGLLRQLEPSIREPFEREGRMVEFIEGDVSHFGAWAAQVLVKVPRRWPRQAGDVPVEAGRLPAAWLVDSRCPLQIPADVPLVERPADAAAILSRVTRSVFLPDGVPGPVPPAIRAMGGSWLALCTPATWR
jgi:hypothetical protein